MAHFHIKKSFFIIIISLLLCLAIILCAVLPSETELYAVSTVGGARFIKWVDFGVSYTAMKQALDYDLKSGGKYNWIELLAVSACKNGGKFQDKKCADIDKTAERLKNGETIESITSTLGYYGYYFDAYNSVLGGIVSGEGKKRNVCAFSPVARGFSYTHSDDFGVSRSYGFSRRHLGNDLMGSVGTPLVAVESGIVEQMGWNRYGGWRLGIRSFDGKRYYYYAHLRKGHPYVNGLKEGMQVRAGDVIGYMGMTGYSDEEDYNGMQKPHLHFGLELIFDESQKDSNNEIWVDVYDIVRLLSSYRSKVVKNSKENEWVRVLT